MIFVFIILLCLAVRLQGFVLPLKPSSLKHTSGLKLAPVLRRQILKPLAMADEDGSGLSLRSVIVGGVILIGVFGTGFITTLQSSIFSRPSADQQLKKDKASTEDGRGALTRLTRREITAKLAQVPVFYVAQSGTQSVYLENGVGSIFLDAQAAQAYSKGRGQVKATSLADVYYPLIAKKAKTGTFLDGPAGSSDPTATYVLSPDPELVRVPKLAFDRPGGLVIPFFLSRDDASTSLKRLQEVGKTAAAESEELQVTSLPKLISLWEQGGFEGRSIEIFPRQADIDAATELLSDK